jgi:YrbI family 3-deoxy-D-manno-octulosonate 8-phosphate phosphatase
MMALPTLEGIDAGLLHAMRQVRLVAFDFDGVFTDNGVYVMQDGTEAVRCSRGDGVGLRKLRGLGIDALILSTETNPVVSARARKLDIECVQDVGDKGVAIEGVARARGLALGQIAFVGNDVNDLPCLTRVGLPMVVHDAHDDVLSHALYRTSQPGGHGAVREICDLFEQVLSRRDAREAGQG